MRLTDFRLGETEITDRHFGGNLVFSQDDVDGTFGDRAAAAGVEVIRFPGGTVTEFYFDPADPDRTEGFRQVRDPETGEVTIVSETLLPLSAFLDYAAENDLGAIMVVPTTRYIDGPERFGIDDGPYLDAPEEAIIRSYVRTVLESGVRVEAFEIGNEFGIWSGLSEEAYGRYVSDAIVAIRDEIDSFEAEGGLPEGYVTPLVSMIMAPYWAVADQDGDLFENHREAAELLVDQLSPEALEALDALTTHRYVTGDYDSIDRFDAPWRNFEINEALIGKDLSYIVSEWNISARQAGVKDWDAASEAERGAIDTGLKHAGAVAALFHELAANGVDVAAVWAVQQQNDKALATREGTGTDLRAGGKMFALLAELAPGMTPVILSRPDQAYDLHAFADRDSQLIVINSRSGNATEISIDMARLLGPTGEAELQILTTAPGQDPRDPDVIAEFRSADAGAALVDGTLTLPLDPWEVAVLRVDAGGDTLTAEDAAVTFFGGNGTDMLFGGAGDDLLEGGLHDDALDGAGGDDTLAGGDGRDTLVGQAGDDRLDGGDGDDRLFGTEGRDALDGGAGDDTMLGGIGDDLLTGGDGDDRGFGNGGADTMVGGAGSDQFFGQAGDDLMRGGDGEDTLRGGTENDRIEGEEGADFVSGDLGDDTVLGGIGNDSVYGGFGADLLEGGAGADFLGGGVWRDTLDGGAGHDVFAGGKGPDTFLFGEGDKAWREQILDFEPGRDTVVLDFDGVQLMEDLAFKDDAGGVILNYGGGSIQFQGLTRADLDDADIAFL